MGKKAKPEKWTSLDTYKGRMDTTHLRNDKGQVLSIGRQTELIALKQTKLYLSYDNHCGNKFKVVPSWTKNEIS